MTITFSNVGGALSPDDLQNVERRLQVRLPSDLRAHYLNCNGGQPHNRFFLDEDGNDYEIDAFARMVHRSGTEPLLEETYERLIREKQLIPTRVVPFAFNSGGDLYCIDIGDQSIWFWAADSYEPSNLENAMTKVAPSLREFIGGMISEDEAYG